MFHVPRKQMKGKKKKKSQKNYKWNGSMITTMAANYKVKHVRRIQNSRFIFQ